MNKEEQFFQKRMKELADMAYYRNTILFSDFLNLNELNIFYHTVQTFPAIRWETFGGYEMAERKMAAFIPDSYFPEEESRLTFPISGILIEPRHEKFAETLTHRDYLGALMNLGVERSVLGDILVTEKKAFLFCENTLQDYILSGLTKVRHTFVSCKLSTNMDSDWKLKTQLISGSVASIRLDSVLALAFGSSRSSLISYIENGKVFVNGKLITSNGYSLQENDIVSARGLGKFRYIGFFNQTKKGRFYANIEKYC